MEERDHRRALHGQDRGRVRAARRLHADLLVDPPAALQRARAGVLRQRRRRDRLRVGQRRLRDERMGEGPGRRQHRASSPTATASSATAWACWSTRPTSASASARGATRCSSNDGVIEKMFIEPEKEGDPFEVSDADTMLALRRPEARRRRTRSRSSPATAARTARTPRRCSTTWATTYEEVPLGTRQRSRIVGAVTGEGTVPQVFIDGEHIGGAEELERWAREGGVRRRRRTGRRRAAPPCNAGPVARTTRP